MRDNLEPKLFWNQSAENFFSPLKAQVSIPWHNVKNNPTIPNLSSCYQTFSRNTNSIQKSLVLCFLATATAQKKSLIVLNFSPASKHRAHINNKICILILLKRDFEQLMFRPKSAFVFCWNDEMLFLIFY